jgi:hypothetical protein
MIYSAISIISSSEPEGLHDYLFNKVFELNLF